MCLFLRIGNVAVLSLFSLRPINKCFSSAKVHLFGSIVWDGCENKPTPHHRQNKRKGCLKCEMLVLLEPEVMKCFIKED